MPLCRDYISSTAVVCQVQHVRSTSYLLPGTSYIAAGYVRTCFKTSNVFILLNNDGWLWFFVICQTTAAAAAAATNLPCFILYSVQVYNIYILSIPTCARIIRVLISSRVHTSQPPTCLSAVLFVSSVVVCFFFCCYSSNNNTSSIIPIMNNI